MKPVKIAVLSISALLLGACRKDDSKDLKVIQDELKKSNDRLEEMQRNQIKEREGRAAENMRSYFQ